VLVPVALRLGWTDGEQSARRHKERRRAQAAVHASVLTRTLLSCVVLLLGPAAAAFCSSPSSGQDESARRSQGNRGTGAQNTEAERAGEVGCVEKQTVHEVVRSALDSVTCLARSAKLRIGDMRAVRRREVVALRGSCHLTVRNRLI